MKNNKLLLVFWMVIIVVFVTGCSLGLENVLQGNGNVTTVEKDVTGFEGVILDGISEVNIYHAENFKVNVTTDSNIHDIMIIKKENNNLIISQIDPKKQGYNGFNATKLTVDVHLPKIARIELNGIGDIKIHNGKHSDFQIVFSGIGDINALNYEVENVSINGDGIGNIETWATNSLTGSFSGIGNVSYKGNPTTNSLKFSGIGKVIKL